jgi:hypothetical protein
MERNTNSGQDSSRIPQNDPSKAMDSKKEVEQSNDGKTDQDFPGYPHYPAKEDIMDQRTDIHRVDMDVENLPSGRNATGVSQRYLHDQEREQEKEARQPHRDEMNEEDELAVLNSKDEEIGAPQNVSNEDAGHALPGTDVLDEIENIDNDESR